MRAFLIASSLGLLLGAANPALADSRYSCMASDDKIKLALRLEYAEVLGGRLAHFSGALSVLTPDAPGGLKKVTITSYSVTQQWVDRQSILLRIYDDQAIGEPVYMSLGARLVDAAGGRFHGSYALWTLNGKEPALRLEGALTCQIDRLADVTLIDPDPAPSN